MIDVCMVDNDDAARTVVRMEDNGYAVFDAPDGTTGLALLTARTSPAVVILDWWMPNLDGVQLLHALAQNVALARRNAYILLTAVMISETRPLPPLPPDLDVVLVIKPFDVDELVEVVSEAAKRIAVCVS